VSHVLCRLPYINLKRVKRSTTTGRSASATARLSHHAETGAWVGKCIERLSESVVAHPWRRAVGEMWLLVVFHMARAAKVAKRIASRRVRGHRCNAILCAGPSWRQGRSIAWHPVWIRSSFDSGLNRDDAALGVDVVTRNCRAKANSTRRKGSAHNLACDVKDAARDASKTADG
jgi:hypothetical protein